MFQSHPKNYFHIALFDSPDNQYRKGDTDIFKNPKIIELSKIFLDGIERESIRHPIIGHLLESLRSHWLKLISCSYPTSQSQLAACCKADGCLH